MGRRVPPSISSGGKRPSRDRDGSAHPGKRLDDCGPWVAARGFVAADVGAEGLRRQDSGEHTDGRAGVARIQAGSGRAQTVEAAAMINTSFRAPQSLCQRTHAIEVEWQSAPVE